MATLEKIRNRAGNLVAVVIGLALLAFILGDFLNSRGGSLFSDSQFEIAEIAGKSISYQIYQKELNDIIEITKFTSQQSALDAATVQRIQEQTWNMILRNNVLEDEYSELGIDISSQELWDMVQGENIHPIIRNYFTNRETGIVNTAEIIRFLKTYEQDPTGQQETFWIFIETQIIQDRMFSKYSTIISKGLYATKAEAQSELDNINKKVDFEFVSQNLNTIPDSLIEISSNDLKDYYNNHQNDFKQTASRSIDYITFDVVPSETDKATTEQWINNIKVDFTNTENDIEFVNKNSDVPSDNLFYKKDELTEELRDIMFDAEEGFIHGPYFTNETYYLAKLAEVKYLPDSVKARHILLQPTQNQNSNQIFALADSIKTLLENGANFATLSDQFSVDKAANEKGGDLGWFRANQMVTPFSDSCFSASVREIKLVATQYGLHIAQVTNKARNERKVKLAILARKLEPSSETYQQTYSNASKFAGNNHSYEEFLQAIEKESLTKKVATNVQERDQELAGLESPREFVRSIYSTEINEIIKSRNNPIFELDDRFVIGFVTEIKEDGYAPFEQVESQVTVQVKKQKKAELLAEKFNNALLENNNLSSLANYFNTEVYEATDITFRSYSIPDAGIEPKLVAVATSSNADVLSKPVKGSSGVYVLMVNSIGVEENTNIELQQKQTMMQYQNRANYEAFEALKETANVIDKRAKFY